ncbi:MAG: hypothetical protein RL033_1585 [Pseudomonadota bacterium]
MARSAPIKLIPRNATAARRPTAPPDRLARHVTGNSVSTRLESGVGNCFPGLECDLRNLERRFFPFLEVDVNGSAIFIRAVDSDGVDRGVADGSVSPALATVFRVIAAADPFSWRVERIRGSFGSLGTLDLDVQTLSEPSFGDGRLPPDAWTALRMLDEDEDVTLTVSRDSDGATRTLTAPRVRYLDEDGALSDVFTTGELTQSLCSPWTHDFRDCGCFYWASNHPDITFPPVPAGQTPGQDRALPVDWQRLDPSPANVPTHAVAGGPVAEEEVPYYRINSAWQLLNFVLEGRERLEPYEPGHFTATTFADAAELEQALRTAASVELAVVQEYLTAAYSLRDWQALPSGALQDDIRAAEAELLRIAFSEMRHVRAVNDVLFALPRTGAFQPALRVASSIPGVAGGVAPRPATQQTLERFIAIEQPSTGVDGLYARILATLDVMGTDDQEQTIRSVIAEGVDHLRTFRFVRDWLGRNPESAVLRPGVALPAPSNPLHVSLQTAYRAILEDLFQGYAAGLPAGAVAINRARSAMPSPGLDGRARALANANLLVSFDVILDPRFAPLP